MAKLVSTALVVIIVMGILFALIKNAVDAANKTISQEDAINLKQVMDKNGIRVWKFRDGNHSYLVTDGFLLEIREEAEAR
jgi:hypothetical protein